MNASRISALKIDPVTGDAIVAIWPPVKCKVCGRMASLGNIILVDGRNEFHCVPCVAETS